MRFFKYSIREFNSLCDTQLDAEMTFEEAVENIEYNKNNYFYVSMSKEDVEEAINSEDVELIEQLDINPIYIDELGIFIALQP